MPPLSSAGVHPFSLVDTPDLTFAIPGVLEVRVNLGDDDGGQTTDALTKLIVDTRECPLSHGFWRKVYDRPGHKVDADAMRAYLDITRYVSRVFDETVPMTTFDEALAVLDPEHDHDQGDHADHDAAKLAEKRDKATREVLTAWLNFASGAVGWDETVVVHDGDADDDDHPEPRLELAFNVLMRQAEDVLLSPAATLDDLELAKDLAEAVNDHGEDCDHDHEDVHDSDSDSHDGDHGSDNDGGKDHKDKHQPVDPWRVRRVRGTVNRSVA